MTTNISELEAQIREKSGTGASREVRNNNAVPCIIYGENKNPILISINNKQIKKEYEKTGFFSKQLDIKLNGEKHRVLAKDIQLHPVKESIIHVDFLRIGKNTKVTVAVQVKFINQNMCDGLKQGGVINIVRREIDLISPVESIPEFLEANLDGLQIGDSIHISSINLASDVKPLIKDRDFTIATIAPPTVINVEEDKSESTQENDDTSSAQGQQDEKTDDKTESKADDKSEKK